jgi:hypothetical protein
LEDTSCLEDTPIEQVTFSTLKYIYITFQSDLELFIPCISLLILLRLSESSGRDAATRHLTNGMKDMADTPGVKARSVTLETCNVCRLHCYFQWNELRYDS